MTVTDTFATARSVHGPGRAVARRRPVPVATLALLLLLLLLLLVGGADAAVVLMCVV
jgi:hypothetical protein